MTDELQGRALGNTLPQDFRLEKVHLSIRAAEEGDLPTISCLRADEPEHARRRLDSQAAGRIVYLLALLNNLPVGTAVFHWRSTTRIPTGASVSDLYVIPQLRGLHIGTNLLHACEALARAAGIHQISLAVNPTENRRARLLYERLGYHDPGGQPYLDAIYRSLDASGEQQVREDWVVDMVKNL